MRRFLFAVGRVLIRMAVDVFDSLDKIRGAYAGAKFLDAHPARARALQHHFEKRGIVQLDSSEKKSWPRLVYPTPEKLEGLIVTLEEKMRSASLKRKDWQASHWKSSTHATFSQFSKLSDPLFWQHAAKSVIDSEYRKDSKSVGMNTGLIADKKYRPMVDAFVHSSDYRKQLTEAVQNSVVYKDHKGLGKHAHDRHRMQTEVAKSLLDKIEAELKENQAQLQTWKELLSWAREK